MKNDKKILDIQLLDRTLQIKAPLDKLEDLQKAAYYLDSKLREIRDNGTATGNERIALLAALNITYELISTRKQKDVYLDSISGRIKELQNKIDHALAPETDELL